MGIFRNRPFALGLALLLMFSFGIAAVACSGICVGDGAFYVRIVWIFLCIAAVVAVIVLAVLAVRKRKHRTRLLAVLLTVLIVLLGVLRAGEYFLLRYADVQSLVGSRAEVTLSIDELQTSSPGYARYHVTVESVSRDGEVLLSHAVSAAFVVYGTGDYCVCDRLSVYAELLPLTELLEEPIYALSAGEMLLVTPALREMDEETDEESDDTETAYESVELLSSASPKMPTPWEKLLLWSVEVRDRLSFILTEEIGGREGRLAAAVLLGDRRALDDETVRDFGRAGVSHLLALSGLHMSILVGGFALLLRRLGVPRRGVSVFTLVAICVFLLITGFSMSACRAGLMLAFVALTGLVSRKPDTLTTLFAAVAVIFFVFPAAVFSVGLWMSFASVLGLVIFTSAWESYFRRRISVRTLSDDDRVSARELLTIGAKRVLLSLLAAVGVSLIANFAILPILYVTGGEFALFGVLTNIVTVPVMPFLLVCALAYLVFYRIAVVGTVLSFCIRTVSAWLIAASEAISQIPHATVSLRYPFAGVCVLVFLIPTVLLLVIPMRKYLKKGTRGFPMRLFLLPVAAACALFAVCLSVHTLYFRKTVAMPVNVSEASEGETLVYASGGKAVLFDCSGGAYKSFRIATDAAELGYATEWDAVVLTHYHTRHIASVARICRSELVRRVYLPVPASEKEQGIMEAIVDRLSLVGVPYTVFERSSDLTPTSGLSVWLSHEEYLERSARAVFYMSLEAGGETLTYLTRATEESSLGEAAETAARESEYLVYGSDGPKRKAIYRIPHDSEKLKRVFTYGEENERYLSPISRRALEERGLWINAECRMRKGNGYG